MQCPHDCSIALFPACSKTTRRTADSRRIITAPCDYCSNKFEVCCICCKGNYYKHKLKLLFNFKRRERRAKDSMHNQVTWHVFEQLKHYCNSVPLWNMGLRKGVSYPFTQILTRSYLMTLYNLFYKQENEKMVKFISDELIIYLNPVVLAYQV